MTRWLWIMIALTVVTFAGTLYLYEFREDLFPAQVPVHWGVDGKPDAFKPRSEVLPYLLIAPGVMAAMIMLALVLPWLSPQQFSIERFRPTYEYIMVLIVTMFGYVQLALLLASIGVVADQVFVRLMVGGMMLFFALLGNVLGKVRRNFYVGIRTPWTIASELVWNQTHRVGAWLYAAGGLLAAVAMLLGVDLILTFVAFMLVVLFPIPYSLWLYKRLQREGKLDSPTETVS